MTQVLFPTVGFKAVGNSYFCQCPFFFAFLNKGYDFPVTPYQVIRFPYYKKRVCYHNQIV